MIKENNLRDLRKGVISVEDFVEKNFETLMELHIRDMPYGVAKARTGDPYTWLINFYENSHEH